MLRAVTLTLINGQTRSLSFSQSAHALVHAATSSQLKGASVMHHRRFSHPVAVGVLLLSLFSMLLTACGGSSSGGTVHLTFWSWVPGLQDQVNEWNSSHPNIQVTLNSSAAGTAMYNKLKVALRAGSGAPDVVQIEYQYLPTFTALNDLVNLVPYGANNIQNQFVPWTWSQVSSSGAVYGIPQDSGPMGMMYRKDIFDQYHLTVPTTWDQFAQDAATLHKANPSLYLANFTSDPGSFFGLLWQSGAHPFTLNGTTININFSTPEVLRVANLWGNMLSSGVLSPLDSYTNDWNSALANGTIASWQAGAWGPGVIQPAAPNSSGKWQVAEMPQWTAGAHVDGNYGGSSDAVLKTSQHPSEAAQFAIWLNTNAQTTLQFATGKASLFPVTTATLNNSQWSDTSASYWGGQQIAKAFASYSQNVDTHFSWSPFQDFVYSTFSDQFVSVKSGSITFAQAMKNLQDKVSTYAQSQGFTVANN
jgi:multiple sugar transport system substrate-binding protein